MLVKVLLHFGAPGVCAEYQLNTAQGPLLALFTYLMKIYKHYNTLAHPLSPPPPPHTDTPRGQTVLIQTAL